MADVKPPGQDAIAAALRAIQRLGVETDSEESVSAAMEAERRGGRTCVACGSHNRAENSFCASCGVPLLDPPPGEPELSPANLQSKPAAQPGGQHHYHHHYHHHYFSPADGMSPTTPDLRAANTATAGREAARVRAPLGGPSLSRAEVAVRKVTQDWALACNTKQLDDLLGLYAADAIVLRPNVPPVRGAAAIREFFFSALDAGLGEVEMEPLRVELLGDVAYEVGRCKMLVPSAMGKRREERGKYLVVLTRQTGDWKVTADSVSADLSLGVSAEPAAKPNVQAPRKGS
jgi:ketosteroid isomerase-like protein